MPENQTTPIAFQFEVTADESNPADPATLGEVSRYVAQKLRTMGLSSLIKSYLSVFSTVSPSHAGQVVSIFKLPPRR